MQSEAVKVYWAHPKSRAIRITWRLQGGFEGHCRFNAICFYLCLITILDLPAQLCLIRRLKGWQMKTSALDLFLWFVLFLTQIRHQNNHSAFFFFSSLQEFLMKFFSYPFSPLGLLITTKHGHPLDLEWYKITIFYYQIPWK